MKRGTRVAIIYTWGDHVDGVGGKTWQVGKVSSRTKNGWLRVKVSTNVKPIIIRNSKNNVLKLIDIQTAA